MMSIKKKVEQKVVSRKVYVPPCEQYSPRGRAISMREALEDSNVGLHLPPYRYETKKYCPGDRNHSEGNWSAKHGVFTIRYSIPRSGGRNQRAVVASVWVEPKKFSGHGVKGRLHINVDKLVGPHIEKILSKDFQAISQPWRNYPSLDEMLEEEMKKKSY